LNEEGLYKFFIEENKEFQSVLDDLNNIKSKGLNDWNYDFSKGKFILSEECIVILNYIVTNLSDFYKWQLIISIMKTIKQFPPANKQFQIKNLRKKYHLKDSEILNPPM